MQSSTRSEAIPTVEPDMDLQSGNGQRIEAGTETAAVNAYGTCRLPSFWRVKPDLWFVQVEAAFQLSHIRSDDTRYNLVISMLDTDTLVDIEDVIRAPPVHNKYSTIKATILSRLTDSADRQLLKLFTQLELGDKRPSQLLRHMRSLAGTRVSDEVLRVKWLDLLPVGAQRLLRILKTPCLGELAAMADEIVDSTATVATTSTEAIAQCEQPAVAAAGSSRATTSSGQLDCIAAELGSIRMSLAQLIGINREVLARLEDDPVRYSRERARNHHSRSRPRSPSATTSGVCSFHRRWGEQVARCLQPCSYRSSGNSGN